MPVIVRDEELARLGLAAHPEPAGKESLVGHLGLAAQERAGLPLRVFGSTGPRSNNWVISGSRTVTGKPFLANDMHLATQMPSIWFEIGLHGISEQGEAGRTGSCPFNLRGYSFPGVPGVIAGHNDRIAWGHTNLAADVQNLYIERINPRNPDQDEVNGHWADMEIRCEKIEVHGQEEPYILRVRHTRHGPVLSDLGSWEKLNTFDQAAFEIVPYLEGLDLGAAEKAEQEVKEESEKQRQRRGQREREEIESMEEARARPLIT